MWSDAEFRPDIPSTARMYDYYLGGKDNYPADREAAEKVIEMMPPGLIRSAAVRNREFLGRAVSYLVAELGIRQFIDIGAGLPTMNSVHQVAQSLAPDSRVVYVDHDPVVIAHARDLLHGNPGATIIRHDLRDPCRILSDPELTALLDLSQPVAVLLIAILHFISRAEDPRGIIARLLAPLPEGSCLVVSHATGDSFAQLDDAIEAYATATSAMCTRTRAEVEALFSGLELAEPGVVWLTEWSRDPRAAPAADPGRSLCWCGVARKPAGATTLPPEPARPAAPEAAAATPPRINARIPADFRPDVPSPARMYDYYMGGKDNYPADRAAAEAAIAMMPDGMVHASATQNRRFLIRAVRHLALDYGIRQFLDIGTGLPTMDNVHQVAQRAAPDSRVVYVDNDPIVVAHARDLLHGSPGTTIIRHDLRDPSGILADPVLTALLDLSQPVAVLLVAILQFVTDAEDPRGIVDTLMAAVPSGSYLVLSHFTSDSYAKADEAAHVYDTATSRVHSRTKAQVTELFRDCDLVAPGMVWTPQWRPDSETAFVGAPGRSLFWCGVARKN
jgi:SAM-dependent methyltransferase